jgi:hypothetical protein
MSQQESTRRLRVGAAKYMLAGTIRFQTYRASGEIAIEVMEGTMRSYVATVAMVPSGAPHPGPSGCWLKGWSENEGVPEARAEAGIVRLTGRQFSNGFVTAVHAELTEKARTARLQQQGKS